MSIELQKRAETAKKIILTKGIDPRTLKVNMKLMVDSSGSMDDLYDDGVVQDLVERTLGVGMNLDVNKSIEVFTFDHQGKEIGVATENNYKGFMRGVHAGGGTSYAPVMNMVMNGYWTQRQTTREKKVGFLGKLFGAGGTEVVNEAVKIESSISNELPILGVMVTDGENMDRDQTARLIRESSNKPIFWQFIGIGYESFRFLKELDNLTGRVIDNANFFEVRDLTKISDEELYSRMLNEFPKWYQAAKQKGILK